MTELAGCQRCPRLTAFRREQSLKFPDYHCAPVAAFGPADAALLIVGLAPGLHGANASGRPFTGDASGDLLFRTLHKFDFASQPQSKAGDDGMRLHNCRITNAVKCLPPQNRPNGDEINRCNPYLLDELSQLPAGAVVLALGVLAHRSILKALGLGMAKRRFQHRGESTLNGGLTLVDSYHCSRYNINTGRLTPEMFEALFARIRELLR